MGTKYCIASLVLSISFSCFGAMPKNPPMKPPEIQPASVMQAGWLGNAEWISMYLDEGADPNAVDAAGLTLLARACVRGHDSVAAVLLNNKASVELVSLGKTPLMWAAYSGHVTVIEQLIKNKVELDSWEAEGNTALMFAVQEDELEAAECLLKAGASLFVRNKSGVTPFDWASKRHHAQAVALLKKYEIVAIKEMKEKQAVEKEGYEVVQMKEMPVLDSLENKNAPTLLDWCVGLVCVILSHFKSS